MPAPKPMQADPGTPISASLNSRVAIVASGQNEPGGARIELAAEVTRRINEAGGTLCNRVENASVPQQLAHIEQTQPDLVIAVGGDGTVNAAAGICLRFDVPLVIVPAGTMNLVAKDLRLPLDTSVLFDALDRFTVVRIDTAEVNDRHFLHSAVLGLVPEMTRIREAMRSSVSFHERAQHLVSLAQTAFSSDEMSAEMSAVHGTASRKTRSIVVSNNRLARSGVINHARETVAAGCLGVYASAHSGPLASAKLLASLGTGRLPDDPETLNTCCDEITIEVDGHDIEIALDGELVPVESPLHFASRPRSLKVALPAATHGEATL